MKSEKGITLISLMIYIIVLSIVIGVIAGFTRYFYRNSNELSTTTDVANKYTRFVQYISEDVNYNEIEFVNTNGTSINFMLKDGTVHKYYYDTNNKDIYFISWDKSNDKEKQIRLCDKVDSFTISLTEEENSRYVIVVSTTINKIQYNNTFIVK